MKYHFASLIACIGLLSSTAHAAIPQREEAAKEEMIDNLVSIHNVFQTMYAPAEWKREYSGWDLDQAVQAAINKIEETPGITLKDYHEILAELFNTPQDYHVGINFHSTEYAFLPFRVRSAEGRYFVAYAAKGAPVAVGDEVVAIDGIPTQKVIESLIVSRSPEAINNTDIELASIYLTLRMGSQGHRVPQGDVSIDIIPVASHAAESKVIAWTYHHELIKGLPSQEQERRTWPFNSIYEAIGSFDQFADMSPLLAKGVPADRAAGHMPINDKEGPLPKLGRVIWQAKPDNLFKAYMFFADNGKPVGYIRIPHFKGMSDNLEKDLAELRMLAGMFQRKTEGLVIDITDNSGGYMHILLAYLSIFTKTPMPLLKQRISLTQEDVVQSLDFIEQLDTYIPSQKNGEELEFYLLLRDYFRFICSEWNEGRTLTAPTYLYGFNKVIPDKVKSYSRPILVLANGLDFSCADIFPAVLQGCGRATIFGAKTAGAGGNVRTHTYPNRLGIAGYTYTATIIQRPDNRPLENLGIDPDIPYELTADDLQHGYRGYIKAVNRALRNLIK